jgi:hypothetical protein
MRNAILFLFVVSFCAVALSAEVLPEGIKAVWDINKAYKETTPTREKICINGLWQTVICGLAPWQFPSDKQSFKRTFRRSAFVLSRILGNMNVDIRTPLVERFNGQVGKDEKRWLTGLYLDQPEEWDDPYRFFRW